MIIDGRWARRAQTSSSCASCSSAGTRETARGWKGSSTPRSRSARSAQSSEGRPYRGVEGFRQALADYDRDWDDVRFVVHEIRGAGDRVASSVNIHSRGRASGVELDVPLGFLWEFRNGLVTQMRSFSDPAEALAGLE